MYSPWKKGLFGKHLCQLLLINHSNIISAKHMLFPRIETCANTRLLVRLYYVQINPFHTEIVHPIMGWKPALDWMDKFKKN